MAPKTLSNGESRATAGVFAEHPDVQVGITGDLWVELWRDVG
jgi:hypothetical protein